MLDLKSVEVHPADRGPALAPEFDGAPDAYGGQAWAPVPAEAELGLTHSGAFGVPAPLIGGTLARVVERAVEAQGKRVGLSRAYPPTHVEDCLPEHIAMPADLLAVEPDRREGVQPVEDEEHPLIGPERFRR